MTASSSWVPRGVGQLNVNIYAPVASQHVNVEVIIQNYYNKVMGALTKSLFCHFAPLTAELFSIYEALMFCLF